MTLFKATPLEPLTDQYISYRFPSPLNSSSQPFESLRTKGPTLLFKSYNKTRLWKILKETP